MALMPCPECGTEISTEAAACPKCGYRRAPAASDLDAPRWLRVMSAGAMMLVLVLVAFAVYMTARILIN